MKISRQTWQSIEPLLTIGLDLDQPRREAWLAELESSQAGLLPLLRRMLENHDRAQRDMRLETVSRLAPATSGGAVEGSHVGPFRLLRLLGRGGMGEVWLAAQADGRLAREVALKLPMAGPHGSVWRERFERERDILARLTHPHIAKLYDAGVSDHADSRGQPYLAMEYVEGVSLSEYATRNQLTIAQRLTLFRQVLAAVAYAHRHLVVHRDLKPANILIDVDGQVKLLDFGIAKLVDESANGDAVEALTQIGGRLMTLRYAAPEQAADGEVSTVTDVYSLGVILHELITGLSPYRAVRDGKPFTDGSLLTEEPVLPSSLALTGDAVRERKRESPAALARALAGDLDAIVLKALRRKPADRYATVEQFDTDLLRYLERRPVMARNGTWRYLAGRFVTRNKLPITTLAAVLITMLTGLVLVEQQRRRAVEQRERAEKHFASVRQLANAFVFDVHSEIENIAGSLKARQTLVGTALKYLDSLAGESGNDPLLGLEVATAYRKLAEIRGDVYTSHLGELASARRNADQAARLLDAAAARLPANISILRERRILTLLRARLLTEAGDASSVEETAKAVALAGQIVALPGTELADQRNLAGTLAEYGWALAVVKADTDAAAAPLGRAVDLLEKMVRADPADMASRSQLAGAYERSSIAIEMSGKAEQLAPAIVWMKKAVAETASLVRDDAANAAHRQALVKRAINLADTQLAVRDVDGAAANAAVAREAVDRLVAAEPDSVGLATLKIRVLAVSSRIEYARQYLDRTADLARVAIAAYARIPAAAAAGLPLRANLAVARSQLALATMAMADSRQLDRERRIEMLRDARRQLVLSRAFRQELIDRKIDARSAGVMVDELTATIRQCDAKLKVLEQT